MMEFNTAVSDPLTLIAGGFKYPSPDSMILTPTILPFETSQVNNA
jgi:hypothetical protein